MDKVNETKYCLVRSKIDPEMMLLAEGSIISKKEFLDNTIYAIRVKKFHEETFNRFKKKFIGNKYTSVRITRFINKILRKANNMQDVNDLLPNHPIVFYIPQLYVFNKKNDMIKNYRNLKEFYLRKKLKSVANILADEFYNGPFKMNYREFCTRFKSGFIDKYKKSFKDETIDDFLDNL